MAAPVGSVRTIMVPMSPTTMLGTTMVPPSAVAASAVAPASSVAR
jgi:hypothetical protein